MTSDDDDNTHDDLRELWEDEADLLQLYFERRKMILILAHSLSFRAPMFCRDRMEWNTHVEELLRETGLPFERVYRMKHDSFLKLCSFIKPFMTIDHEMSRRRSQGKGPITTEMALHCLLRWLGGGSHHDIRIRVGISKASFYRVVYGCIAAILRVPELAYHFPRTQGEIAEASAGFLECSTNGVMDGCVAAIDGMLLRIQTPASSETGNVRAYFSGHYHDYGINIQAACDSQCRFLYASCAAPGGANDLRAYRCTTLASLVDALPPGKYVVGDNAYICSEKLLTPFSGSQKQHPVNDAFNFYCSQLRIRIEMTFGLFTTKWQIFRRPLQVRLKNVGKIFLCATRLHNFCIDQGEPSENSVNSLEDSIPASTTPVANNRGNSEIRNLLVDKIRNEGYFRPGYNVDRNQMMIEDNIV